ncbi:GAF domain-containing protein [Cohnella lupini]|uniref:Nitrogen regulatory protein A n=1 Tax=Cohnella lupini TaxID=1294267 RepID=A0A3D9IC16_9BACL|nr:GAF domain-containing protein [Cohnella lupini]RED59343.1 nitrogen regulatory protein A [Cohnella lupini]
MDSWETTFMEDLNQLRVSINSDFCALALLDADGFTLRWKLASGNENERYRSMKFQPGRGLSDTVVKVGRAVSLNLAEIIFTRKLHEYPIMLAESLRSAYAVPLHDGIQVIGVLLIGDRKKRLYRPEEKKAAEHAGERISKLVSRHSLDRLPPN